MLVTNLLPILFYGFESTPVIFRFYKHCGVLYPQDHVVFVCADIIEFEADFVLSFNLKSIVYKKVGHITVLWLCLMQYLILLGCSASRGLRQTFSCLSKLGGTTNLIRPLFGHVK